MRGKSWVLSLGLALVVAACGGGEDEDGSSVDTSTGDASAGGSSGSDEGSVIDPQPPGQAMASVDGNEFTFTQPGGVDCVVEENEFSFSFIIGDNEVVVGGGAFRNNSGEPWLTSPDLRVANPDGEEGPIHYFFVPDETDIVKSGNSVSMSGPMEKQPPNDGSNPPPVPAGDGIITFTCP